MPDPVVDVVRTATRSYGRATAAGRPFPDFLILGAKKAGTTSLLNWLMAHPHVLPMFPRWQTAKSPHYFDINYWRGSHWYRSHFPHAVSRAAHQRRTGVRPMSGEASPYYLFHPAAPARIAATIPDVKLVVTLREPVARAYSNYWDRVATGFEDAATFEDAIEAEQSRLAGCDDRQLEDPYAYFPHHDHHSYLARGLYAVQLRRYWDVLPRANMLVLTADRLAADPCAGFERVQDFLGLPRASVPLAVVNERRGYPPMSPTTRTLLAEYYRPHNRELYALLGEDLGW